ncbi:M16 family metallopeptidase [Vibrio sonorensis]|uniref:M16 family metallopeptidase n=1 Tax=Vibrio sonorensis TaxID=1004316 RepID=UPI0008DA06F8|nr:pitrilysin family protein [Vibrio sonorensis]
MRSMLLAVASSAILLGCSTVSIPTLPSISFFSSLPEGVTLVEEVESKSSTPSISYSKYQLDNGLTVILSPDSSDPLVHVDVTYHVGSAREEVGKSGFAHFFEHMMFQGSEHVGDQQHFKLITEAGGTVNGTTNRDRTNYYQTVPSNQLEKVLWLEADRMGFLLDAVSQEKFEIQRDTVKNERAQNFDNRPYGLMWEQMSEAMYPEGHPYSWQTIGYVEDLDRVDVNDLKAFFLRWYGPNNAVLTIGGDIDKTETLKWVKRYFGSIPRGPEVEKAPKQPAVLEADKYVTQTDRIQQPMVLIGWPTQYRGHPDQASIDILAQVLGGGANGLLYQELVKTQKALNAGAFQDCAELACTFYVYAMGKSGDNSQLTPLYNELIRVLDEFALDGVKPKRLSEIKGMAEANAVFATQSVRGKVTQLAANETFFGQPDRLQSQLEQLQNVSISSISQAFDRYLADKPKVVLSVVPNGKLSYAVRDANFVTPPRTLPNYAKVDPATLDLRKPVDDFDRSVVPQVSEGIKASMPDLYRFYYENGIEVLGTESRETPTVQLLIKLPAGERYAIKGKEGLAKLTAAMIQEGSKQRTLEELSAALDELGSEVSINAGNYTTSISISVLERNLSPTLDIVAEVLFAPAFEPASFDRLKKQMLEGVVFRHQKASWLASQATRQVLFGDTAFGRSNDGTEASLQSLTLEDVKTFYKEHYVPQGTQIVVVGDIREKDINRELAFLNTWKEAQGHLLRPQIVPKVQGRKIYLVNKPDSFQSVVRFVRQGLPYDVTGEVFLTQLANFNLAGNFNSRLNQNLREDKGYTYGASGYFASNREVGALIFNAQVRADVTVQSIEEIHNELANFANNGLTQQELSFMRLAVGQQDALKYETPSQKAQMLSMILAYGLDENYLKQRNEVVENIPMGTLNSISSKWFNPEDFQIIVVGDAASLKPQLEKLDIPIEELEIIR